MWPTHMLCSVQKEVSCSPQTGQRPNSLPYFQLHPRGLPGWRGCGDRITHCLTHTITDLQIPVVLIALSVAGCGAQIDKNKLYLNFCIADRRREKNPFCLSGMEISGPYGSLEIAY